MRVGLDQRGAAVVTGRRLRERASRGLVGPRPAVVSVMTALADVGVIPIVELLRTQDAVPLARALVAGGLGCAEITYRTSAASASIAAIRAALPDMLVGAGTVLTTAQVDEAISAGAAFLVAPGFNSDVVAAAGARGVPIIPGVCTPTEIEAALSHGIDILKFFPAEAAGGVAFLKAVAGPYRSVRFIPTGGIDAGNLGAYLALPSVLACGGTWVARMELIAAGDFVAVERLAAEAKDLVTRLRGATAAAELGASRAISGGLS